MTIECLEGCRGCAEGSEGSEGQMSSTRLRSRLSPQKNSSEGPSLTPRVRRGYAEGTPRVCSEGSEARAQDKGYAKEVEAYRAFR